MVSIEEDGVNIGSKLPGQLLQVHRLRTECFDLKERAAALKLEKMRLEKEVEKQERELEAVNYPTDKLRFEEMSSFVNNGGPKMGQSISISLTDQYLRMRTELHRLKELLKEEKRKYRVIFLTGPPLKMSLDWPPPKNASTGPPYFEKVLSMATERGGIPNT